MEINPRARLLRSGSTHTHTTPRDYGTATDGRAEVGVEAVLGADDIKKRSTREIKRRNELRKALWLPERDEKRGRTTSFCTAQSYNMERLFDFMRRRGRQPQFFQEVIHVPYGDDELCDLFFFPYGVCVMWGLRRSDELKVLSELRESQCEEQPLGPDTKDDDFRFVYQDSFPRMLEDAWARAVSSDPKSALRMVSIVRDELRLPSMRLKGASDGASSTDPERRPSRAGDGGDTAGETAGEETAGEQTEDERWRARAERGAETEPEPAGAGRRPPSPVVKSEPSSPRHGAPAAADAAAAAAAAAPSPTGRGAREHGDRRRWGQLGYRIQDILYKLAYSHAIGLSVKLDDFESRTQRTIERTRKLPEEMARDGRISLSTSGIARHVGHLFLLRSSVNLHSEMLDVPEFFWEFSELEPLYLTTASYLNLKTRVRVLNQRLDALKEFDEVLVDQMNDKNASFLMRVIIALIAINIVIYVAAEWGGHLRRALAGSS